MPLAKEKHLSSNSSHKVTFFHKNSALKAKHLVNPAKYLCKTLPKQNIFAKLFPSKFITKRNLNIFFSHNHCMASGRVFGIKKSTILRATTLIFCAAFVAYIFMAIFWLKIPSLWFYGFCIAVGGVQLAKSFLFRYDSSLYLGVLLFLIGVFGHVFLLTNTTDYAGFFVALAFILASTITFALCRQRFHLVVAFSTLFVTLYCLLYVKNLINVSILIAFVLPFLLLLLLEILVYVFTGNKWL